MGDIPKFHISQIGVNSLFLKRFKKYLFMHLESVRCSTDAIRSASIGICYNFWSDSISNGYLIPVGYRTDATFIGEARKKSFVVFALKKRSLHIFFKFFFFIIIVSLFKHSILPHTTRIRTKYVRNTSK